MLLYDMYLFHYKIHWSDKFVCQVNHMMYMHLLRFKDTIQQVKHTQTHAHADAHPRMCAHTRTHTEPGITHAATFTKILS